MSGSDVNYDDNEANWETPLMRSHVPANDYGVNGNSNSSDNWGGNMGPSTSKGARVSSKQLFNGLACLLVTSLCLLLLELRQPGIAHRTAKRLYHNTFVATTTVSLNETPVAQSNYSPVPAPFLVPPKARFNSRDYASPTSEPTVLIGIHFSYIYQF